MVLTNKKTPVLQSVQNGLRILRLFTQEKPVWGITEIAKELQLHKSTVGRLVDDLVTEGFLQKEKKKYSLGFSLLSICGIITSHLEIHRESKDVLKKLVEDLGETAYVSILEGKEITYVHQVECSNPLPVLSAIGKNNPPSCTSSGKVLLAFQTNQVVDSIIEEGLLRLGPNSVTDHDQFRGQLQQIKKQGYAICIDELLDNFVSIAAPVRDYTGEVVASVSVVGTRGRIYSQKISLFTKAVIEAANAVSIRLGYIPSIFESELT